MSTLAYALRDSTTMLRRNVRHSLRYPAMTISGLMVPIFFLLMFVGVFAAPSAPASPAPPFPAATTSITSPPESS